MDHSSELTTTDDFDEELSASKTLKKLTTAWINEKNCPDLLPYEGDAVECMMEQIDTMDENLQQLSRDDFRLVPHQMESNRIRYILASYHRCRLKKIETFAVNFLKRDRAEELESKRLMSPAEFVFAEEFVNNLKEHFFGEAYRYMPSLLTEWNEDLQKIEISPNLDSAVFIRMLKNNQNVLVNDQEVDLSAESRHLLPYKDIMHLLDNESAVFI